MASMNGQQNAPEKNEHDDAGAKNGGHDTEDNSKSNGPEGGFDSTEIPKPPAGVVGYTLKFTIHQATNLTMGDLHAFSSDPYVLAQLNTDIETRHKEDPPLRFRTPTIHRTTDPEWNEEWVVANVPSSGFKLKLRVYDEDPADHDDLLGKLHVSESKIDDDWKGYKTQTTKLRMRESSKRALVIRGAARVLRIADSMHSSITISIENLGRTGEDEQNGRLYTVGPGRAIRHFSPILGRLTNMKDPGDDDQKQDADVDGKPAKKKVERYNFQANQIQLPGPVPPQLYHRFVEFKPWVKRMFTKGGISGVVLGKALHHQHTRMYNFDKDTEWTHFESMPTIEMTKKFLELVHYDKGGRIFTYVLTLDALWRFTETGKEFGIDLLSKHTMHSDVSIYIAFSGEFFIRRLKHRKRPPPPKPAMSQQSTASAASQTENETHPPADLDNGPPDDDPPKDPSYYQLVIDNDSGTYRPNAAMLPILSQYLAHCLPGIHIETLDCQADAEKMGRMKDEQRERKKVEGDNIIYAQLSDSSDSSSLSSSDDERLDDVQRAYDMPHRPKSANTAEEHGVWSTVARDAKQRQQSKMEKLARNSRGKPRNGGEDTASYHGPKVAAGDA